MIVSKEQPDDWPEGVPFYGVSDRETFTYKLNKKVRDRVIAGWADAQMEMGVDVSEMNKNIVYMYILENSKPASALPSSAPSQPDQPSLPQRPSVDRSALDALASLED